MSPNRKIFECLLLAYVLLGFYGAIWIQIDWDYEKLLLYAYVGLPLATVYYFGTVLWPEWPGDWRFLRYGLIGALLTVCFLGNVLWVNAVTTETPSFKRDIAIEGRLVTIANYKGGFGINYHRRW